MSLFSNPSTYTDIQPNTGMRGNTSFARELLEERVGLIESWTKFVFLILIELV